MSLTVDPHIPYGNACHIEVIENGRIPEIRFTPDPHGGPETLWFCFRVKNSIPGECRRLRIVIKNYGKDNFPYDLNRAWGNPPMRHETLVIQRDLLRWQSHSAVRLALDFHAPGLAERSGIYAFLPAAEGEIGQKVDTWAEIAKKGFGDFAAPKFACHAKYASR